MVRNVPDPWHFETDSDPWIHWVTNPSTDPAIIVSGFRDANKKYLFWLNYFAPLSVGKFTTASKAVFRIRDISPDTYELPDLKSREVASRIMSGFTLHLEHRALPRKPQYSQGCGCLSLRPRPLPLEGVDTRAASGMHGFPCSSIQPKTSFAIWYLESLVSFCKKKCTQTLE